MPEPERSILPKSLQSLPALIRRSLAHRQRIKLDRTVERLSALKKEKDNLIDKMDVALRAMQKQRLLHDSDARLTGQYTVEELTPVKGGKVYDINKLTLALDRNRTQIACEEARLSRLSKALTSAP